MSFPLGSSTGVDQLGPSRGIVMIANGLPPDSVSAPGSTVGAVLPPCGRSAAQHETVRTDGDRCTQHFEVGHFEQARCLQLP